MTVEARVIGTIDVVDSAWEQLAQSRGAAPFLHPGWMRSWWNAFGAGEQEILAAFDSGRLVGILALFRRRGVLATMSNWHSPYLAPLAHGPEPLAALGDALASQPVHHIRLFCMPDDENVVGPLRQALETSGWRPHSRALFRSPYLDLRELEWDVYENSLPRKMRAEIRRRRRKLEQEGALELQIVDGGGDLIRILDEGLAIEGSGWKTKEASAIADRLDTLSFYRSMATWAAERGWLRLAFLRLAGRALAFDLCLEHEGTHYLLKTGYDPAFRAFGPGVLIRHEMIRRAFQSGIDFYEFLGDADPWKLVWTEATHARIAVEAFAPSALGRLRGAGFRYGRPVGKWMAGIVRGLGRE
jgi:CelD/BcsL family acetyltransferase involved in cellulose biosynthesis